MPGVFANARRHRLPLSDDNRVDASRGDMRTSPSPTDFGDCRDSRGRLFGTSANSSRRRRSPIKRPISHRLSHMLLAYGRITTQIGNSPRQLQNALPTPR